LSSLSLPKKHTGFLQRGALFLTRWQWLWLVLAAPFFLFPTPSRILFLIIVPVLWLVGWLATGKPLPNTPANLPLLVMMSMVLVSLFATYDIAVSLPKIAGMLLGIGFFYAFIHASRKDDTFLFVLAAFLACGSGIAILGVAGTQWPEKYTFLNSFLSRLPVLFKGLPGAEAGFQPNEVAGALLWVLPLLIVIEIALIIGLYKRTKKHIWWIAAGIFLIGIITLLMFGVLLLTQSRGSLLALALGLFFLPSIFLKWRKIYLGLLLFIFVIIGVVSWRLGWIQKIYLETGNPGQSVTSLSGRVEIWDRAIMGIRDFPITGMGMNTFRYVIIVFYPTDYGSKDLGHAHNEFLQAGLDLGIPGMIGFLSLNLVMFWMLVQTWRNLQLETFEKSTSGFLPWISSAFVGKVLVVGFAGGLLAHLFFGLIDAVALGAKPGVMFWMLMGLITGLYLKQRRNTLTGTTLHA
jgi:putative inorganic carbon (hco3(-)) transporter